LVETRECWDWKWTEYVRDRVEGGTGWRLPFEKLSVGGGASASERNLEVSQVHLVWLYQAELLMFPGNQNVQTTFGMCIQIFYERDSPYPVITSPPSHPSPTQPQTQTSRTKRPPQKLHLPPRIALEMRAGIPIEMPTALQNMQFLRLPRPGVSLERQHRRSQMVVLSHRH